MSAKAFDEYWPYAMKQKDCTIELISRLTTWKRSVGVLLHYFLQLSKLQNQIIEANEMMAKGLEGFETDLGESCKGVFKHWLLLNQSSKKATTASESQVASLVKKRLEILKSDIKKKISAFDFRLKDAQKSIDKARHFTQDAISSHESHMHHRQQLNIATSSPHINYDPWLQERFLQEHLQSQIVSENEYQRKMTCIFQELSAFDAHIVEELKRVLEEYALIKNSYWQQMQAQITICVNQGVQVNPLEFFKSFSQRHNINDSNLWVKERTIEEFSRKPKEIKILKQGVLYRPSVLGMGMWVPLLCVLTETGFFHTFAIPSKQKHLIQYYQTKDLDKSSRDTLSSEKDYLKDHGRPEMSISMGQPRMTIEAVTKKNASHVFEFIILQRKPKTIFSKASEQVKHNEFKALSESDMIEWMALLQKSLQSLFPTGPPSPLFRTQKSIDKKVEQVIKATAAAPVSTEPKFERKSLDATLIQKMDSSVTVNSLTEDDGERHHQLSKSLDLTFDTSRDILNTVAIN